MHFIPGILLFGAVLLVAHLIHKGEKDDNESTP